MKCQTCEEYQRFSQTKSNSRSLAQYVSALDTGQKWSKTALVYYFYTTSDSAAAFDSLTYRNWTTTQKANFREALDSWAHSSRLTFTEETTTMANADMVILMIDDLSYPYLGHAYFPGDSQKGQIYISYNNADDTDFPVGSYDYITFVHEIGHSVGLAHPHDTGGTSSVFPGVSGAFSLGTNQQNQTMYTIMSYNDINGPLTPNQVQSFGFVKGPMAYDIKTVNRIYTGGISRNPGSTTYTLPDSNVTGSTYYESIIDVGGAADTISAGSSTKNATINLNSAKVNGTTSGGGFVSKLGGVDGGFTISNIVKIENAEGGAGDDRIYGNELGNTITGNAGNDIITGGAGNDTIEGGDGNNIMFGEAGNDTIVGGSGFNRMSGGAGNDTIYLGSGSAGIDGGSGTDTLYVPGVRGDWTVTNHRGYQKYRNRKTGKVFNVRNVERIIFQG